MFCIVKIYRFYLLYDFPCVCFVQMSTELCRDNKQDILRARLHNGYVILVFGCSHMLCTDREYIRCVDPIECSSLWDCTGSL